MNETIITLTEIEFQFYKVRLKRVGGLGKGRVGEISIL